jgi:hypothetical protein
MRSVPQAAEHPLRGEEFRRPSVCTLQNAVHAPDILLLSHLEFAHFASQSSLIALIMLIMRGAQ